jgi:hypothetical protein
MYLHIEHEPSHETREVLGRDERFLLEGQEDEDTQDTGHHVVDLEQE